jgi:hypothetical protein
MLKVERKNKEVTIYQDDISISFPENDIYDFVGSLIDIQKDMKYERKKDYLSANYANRFMDRKMDKTINRDEQV